MNQIEPVSRVSRPASTYCINRIRRACTTNRWGSAVRQLLDKTAFFLVRRLSVALLYFSASRRRFRECNNR